MKRNTLLLLLLVLLSALAAHLFSYRGSDGPEYAARVCFASGSCVKAEVADTPEERAYGLMNRTFLADGYGMVFVYPAEDYLAFWMKNTLIPLDVIWIDSKMRVVHIAHATPCTADPCPIYRPDAAAMYVLEVRGGYTLDHSVSEGDGAVVSFL